MGRYSSVQAFADNNANMRSVSYEQATGQGQGASASSSADSASRGPVQAEKVHNPYGSTAGAGSGEFHTYRHARAREMARWKKINADEAEKKAQEEFTKKAMHDSNVEEEKTEKRRRKRERAKEAKRRKKNLKLGGVGEGVSSGAGGISTSAIDEEEFEYTPISAPGGDDKLPAIPNDKQKDDNNSSCRDGINDDTKTKDGDDVPFANDGSFLEQMKKQLAANSKFPV
ncbi:hypothetical protein THAOC_08057 [Thalassiosira oceanica]|uniref:Uncharacterized protein n=1 Tax=Thalassiosira oceanica TaxID=159749 RepID=K0SVX4_THAOC|nr:hypothetical protein THAOC_08057 [Thalassiosira oceanica]|mmetsp:Transcript_29117/g.69328  ORF Transcript_29117/g.69328 Transcript_29117/m.69328 type:complete len:228 (+) Transcript_29117:208-891(+)|eukprot:EJK70568.1 hypothetical protein THAOC_08057 [Thalassiosira oceanica]